MNAANKMGIQGKEISCCWRPPTFFPPGYQNEGSSLFLPVFFKMGRSLLEYSRGKPPLPGASKGRLPLECRMGVVLVRNGFWAPMYDCKYLGWVAVKCSMLFKLSSMPLICLLTTWNTFNLVRKMEKGFTRSLRALEKYMLVMYYTLCLFLNRFCPNSLWRISI